MIPILAETSSSSIDPVVVIVGGLIAVLQVAQLASAFIQRQTGTDAQRQIEPTQMSAIQTKLDALGSQLTINNRETGEIKITVATLDKKLTETITRHDAETAGMFKRINAISSESTETRARVANLERKS